MLFQPCNGHRHPHRQLPLFRRLQLAEPHQPPHPVPRLDELAFEPSMFRTTYRQARRRIHLAPVENRERQITTKAKQKQTLFFAIYSPHKHHPSLADPDDLSESDSLQMGKAIGNQRHEVFEQDRSSTKNNDGDSSLPNILLVFKSAVDSQYNIEFCSLGRVQKLTVLKSSKACVSCCLTVMAGKVLAELFVSRTRRAEPAFTP
jgi:hypothetical protein